MQTDFDTLRNCWSLPDYEKFTSNISSLETLDIEQLTLLEFCSYEYQAIKCKESNTTPELIEWQEESFRSKIRYQRRSKFHELIKDLKKSKRNLYEICHNDAPMLLLKFILRLSGQYDNTLSLSEEVINADIFENILHKIEALLKDPSSATVNQANESIEAISEDNIKKAFGNAVRYFTKAAVLVQKNAGEYTVKGLFYDKTRCLGSVEDIIVLIYQGQQEYPIARCKNCGWDEVITTAKNAAFKKLGKEDEKDKYGLMLYINDYPGAKINLTQEEYSGESIGLAIAVAIMAYFSKQEFKPEIAFTGSILPENFQINIVGHVEDKVCAARCYGIEKVLVPENNLEDAKKGIEKAHRKGAKTDTIVEEVENLQDVEKIILHPAIRVEEEFQKARNLKESNAYKEALEIFDKLIKDINNYLKDYPNFAKYIPESLYRRAIIHLHYGRIMEAGEDYKKAKEEYEKCQGFIGYRELADFYNSYSVYLTDLYNFNDALELVNKSLEIKENPYVYPENEIRKIGSLNQKGQIYTFNGEFEKAEEALLKSLKIANVQGKGGVKEADRVRNYLGMLYIKWEKFQKAFKYLNAVYHTDCEDKRNKAFCLLRMAELYFQWGYKTGDKNKYNESIKYADEGIQVSSNNIYEKGLILRYKGCSLRELKDYKNAINCLEESYKFLEALKSKNINILASVVHLELAKLYIKKDDIEKAKEQLQTSLDFIKAFDIDSAKIYFSPVISDLERAIQELDNRDKKSYKLIHKVIERIPY